MGVDPHGNHHPAPPQPHASPAPSSGHTLAARTVLDACNPSFSSPAAPKPARRGANELAQRLTVVPPARLASELCLPNATRNSEEARGQGRQHGTLRYSEPVLRERVRYDEAEPAA